MADRSDILRKIEGLLRKAESTEYEGEAAVFFAKAQELMRSYAIEEMELWASDPTKREAIITRAVPLKQSQTGGQWLQTLISGIGRLNRCQVWVDNTHAHVAGYPSDVGFTEVMYASIRIQMDMPMVFAQFDHPDVNPKTFQNNFIMGYVNRIYERLKEQSKKETTGMELVSLREKEVSQYVAENVPGLRTQANRKSTFNSNAYRAGQSAGNEVDLNPGGKLERG
jgi:hypothetical protein